MFKELKIDPEFEKILPKLSEDEFNLLEQEIVETGMIINPIITWNNIIIDGHSRYRIAKKHREIPFKTVKMKFECREKAIIWICNSQIGRRNLTAESKRYLIGKRYEAEKRYEIFCGNQYIKKNSSELSVLPHGTRSKIANDYGVSESYVRRAYEYSRGIDAGVTVSPKFKNEALSGNLKATVEEISRLRDLSADDIKREIQILRLPVEERCDQEKCEEEIISIKKFKNYIFMIENAIDAEKNGHCKSSERYFEKTKVWALNKLESVFNDRQHNLQRWLENKPCVFSCSRTGKEIQLKSLINIETLYYFLVFCLKENEGREIPEDLYNSLLLDITERNAP